jgi:hypothetical protein
LRRKYEKQFFIGVFLSVGVWRWEGMMALRFGI